MGIFCVKHNIYCSYSFFKNIHNGKFSGKINMTYLYIICQNSGKREKIYYVVF